MGCMSSREAEEQGVATGPGHGPVIAGRHMFTPPRRRPGGGVMAANNNAAGMSIGAQIGAGIGPGAGIGGPGGAGPP